MWYAGHKTPLSNYLLVKEKGAYKAEKNNVVGATLRDISEKAHSKECRANHKGPFPSAMNISSCGYGIRRTKC